MSFTPRSIAILAAAALSALVIPWQLAAVAMVAVAAVAVGDAMVVRRAPELQRTLPALLSRGVPTPLSIVRSNGPGDLRLRQPSPPDLRVEPDVGEERLEATITANRRGSHSMPPTAVRLSGPLGLGAWYHRTGTEHTVTVFPDMHAARRLVLAVRTGSFRDEGRRSRGPLGLGTDFESIREYHPDDDIRQLNVRATARTGIPMTNQYRVEQDRDVIIVIDCGRMMRAPIGDRTRLDAAVDVAAAVAAVADEVGDRVGVVAFRDRVLRQVRPSRDNGRTVAWAVHDLEPEPVDSDYAVAVQALGKAKRAFVLVLTDLMDESVAGSLAELATAVGRKHALAIAGARDDTVWSLLTTPAGDVQEALETAVAADLYTETQRAAALLAGRGATVIDAPVETLSHRCVATYLAAKRRARI